MKPFFLLIGTFLIALIIIRLAAGRPDYQLAGRIAMAVMLVFTAIGHFAFTQGMSAMVPDFIPFKTQVVYATGVLEIFFAAGLLFPGYQSTIAWLIIVFFILILPANIKAAIDAIVQRRCEKPCLRKDRQASQHIRR